MPQVTFGSGLGTFEAYLNTLGADIGAPSFAGVTVPTVSGQPIADFFGNATGDATPLQLSTAQIAIEFPQSPNNLYLLIDGVGLSLPLSTLQSSLNLGDAGGTVTSADLYAGGSFSNGVLTGGTEIAALSFSATEYSLLAGGASLTMSGANLPTTAGVVQSIFAGTYAGAPTGVSQLQATDNNETITLALSSSAFTLSTVDAIPGGSTSSAAFTISGSGLPASLTATEIDALVTGQGFTYTGGSVGVSELQYSDNGQSITIALSPTSLSISVGDYEITLAGNFPTILTASQINAMISGQGSGLDGDVTSATVVQISTGDVLASAISPFVGGTPLIGAFTLKGGGGAVEAVEKLLYATAGGTIVGRADSATVDSAGVRVDGQPLISGGFAVVGDFSGLGGYELVSSGGVATDTVVLSMGRQFVAAGGLADNAIIMSGGAQIVGESINAYTSGGIASNTIVYGGGFEDIIGGTANNILVKKGGELFDYFGNISGLTLDPGSVIDLPYVGAVSAEVNVANQLVVKSGAVIVEVLDLTADNVRIVTAPDSQFNGTLLMAKSGSVTVTDTAAAISADLDGLNADPQVGAIVISDNAAITVSGGQLANDPTAIDELINANAAPVTFAVAGGATLSGGAVVGGMTLTVPAGAVASGVTIASGGLVIDYGTLDNVVLAGGTLERLNGGAVNGRSGSGAIIYGPGTVLTNPNFNTPAVEFELASGATANGGTVSGGATLLISAGAVASGLTIASGGEVIDDGTLDNVILAGGTLERFGAAVVAGRTGSGTIIYGPGVVLNNPAFNTPAVTFELASGASANGGVVSSGATLLISSGAVASGLTVMSGGEVIDDGTLDNVILAGGTLERFGAAVVAGRTGSGTIIYGPGVVLNNPAFNTPAVTFELASGASANGGVVSSGATLLISSGAVASGLTVMSGGTVIDDGTLDNVVLSGGTLERFGAAVVAGRTGSGTIIYGPGVVLNNPAFNTPAVTFELASGASANGGVVSSGATLLISSGAVASGLTVMSGGTVIDDGTLDNLVLSGGTLERFGDAVVVGRSGSGTLIYGGGVVLTNPSFNTPAIAFELASGSVANGGTVSSGVTVTVEAGATASGVTVLAGGSLINNGGLVISAGAAPAPTSPLVFSFIHAAAGFAAGDGGPTPLPTSSASSPFAAALVAAGGASSGMG